MRYHFTPTRVVIKKKKHTHTHKITNVGEDMEKREPLYVAGGNVKHSAAVENCLVVTQKVN